MTNTNPQSQIKNQKSQIPKRFTDRDVLFSITVKHLAQFFEYFSHLLANRHLPLPHSPPGTEGYYHDWVSLFKSPEKLPAPLVDAVLAIEELAAPENRPLLESKLAEARAANPWLDSKESPECLALQLWLIGLAATERSEEGPSCSNSELRLPNPQSAIRNPQSTGPILPSVKIDSDAMLVRYFMPPQIAWILGEDELHAQKRPVFALAEKSVRIGWTYADGFKNVRKRLHFPNRDYLFVTKDYPSALEYMLRAHDFARLLNFTRAIVAHGEDYLKVKRLGPDGQPTPFEEEIKVSYIKFDNKSRILAFSAHPQAMAVYGGDVGLDEFAKHPNAQLLWQTAQGRVTWGFDMAVWSSHEGEDTLFNQFAQQARAGKAPWNLYYRVTIVDAIQLGLLDLINRTQGTHLTPEQFLADAEARAGLPEIFQQTYMCNPVPGAAGIVDWSAIERCRYDYPIERVHLEAAHVAEKFGPFNPGGYDTRATLIHQFLRKSFPSLFGESSHVPRSKLHAPAKCRLGFDVAASGEGDLAVFYIDEVKGSDLWLRGLLTVRTEDWDFLQTVLFYFLQKLPSLQAAGDSTGLGQQICWQAAQRFSSRFLSVNFTSKKSDLGFALMNQLSVAQKRFPRSEQDIASDYFALRKTHTGTKWVFSEGRNIHNPASHCDIAWAGALATHTHTERKCTVGAAVVHEHGNIIYDADLTPEEANRRRMLLSNDPAIWKPFKS